MAAQLPIVQMAYVVSSLEDSAHAWNRTVGAGPFFTGDHSVMREGTYRGQKSEAEFRYAVSYSGAIQIELIEQTNDAPSIYREVLASTGPGYHHFMPLVADFDAAVLSYARAGAELAFEGRSARLGRVAFVDGRRQFGGFVEIVEPSPTFLRGQDILKMACADWDGSGDLVRPMSALRPR
jgi:hypothetical protein